MQKCVIYFNQQENINNIKGKASHVGIVNVIQGKASKVYCLYYPDRFSNL